MNVLVIGLGNPLYGDDGFGSCLARALSRSNQFVVDGDARGFDVAVSLGGVDVVYIVDVVDFLSPGDVALVKLEPEELGPVELTALDVHRVPPTRIIQYARSMVGFRGRAYLVGVGVGRIDLLVPPSEDVLGAVGKVVELIKREIAKFGLEIKYGGIDDLRKEILRCYSEAGVRLDPSD